MDIMPIDDRTLIILAGLIVGMVCFALLLFAIVVVKIKSIAPQFQGTRIWPFICLVVCAMVMLLLSLRGLLSGEMIATLLGASLGYAFGLSRKKEA